MDRFVTRGAQPAAATTAASGKPRQRRLEQLKKVVTLDAGTTALCFKEEDLARFLALLQDGSSAVEELILTLRKLSCHEISKHDLEHTAPLLHPTVQMLEYHSNAEVARIAGRLVDKWMQLEDRRGKPPPASSMRDCQPSSQGSILSQWSTLALQRQR